MTDEKEKINLSALFRIGYGLYVLTTNDGRKDNGCIVNSVMQVTSNPLRVAVCVNKQNYSCGTILETLKMNVNCLSVDATFDVFKRFGFQSGRTVDKFFGETPKRSENGLVVLSECCNAFISLAAEQIIDLGTHDMFVCSVEEAAVFSDLDTLTYTEYQKREAEARRAKEEIVRLQSVRLRFRGRRTAARLHLSDMQARRVGV